MIRILLADDHATFREGITNLLQSDATLELVAEAKEGDEAWQLIQQHVPDVAILDISMPGLNGIEVASQSKETGLRTRVVLLTSHDDPTLTLQAVGAGVTGYILKEDSFDKLALAVKAVHCGGQFMSLQVFNKLIEFLKSSQRSPFPTRQ